MVIASARVTARENRTRLMACSDIFFRLRQRLRRKSPAKKLNYPHEASDDLLSDPSKDLKTEEGKDR